MENQVQQFFNDNFGEVRAFKNDNEILFVANDIAKALGYKNPSKATNDHCKKSNKLWGNDSLGRQQEFKVVPESDVYRLIIKSKLEKAEEFETWLFEVVIPTLRKDGMYVDGEEKVDLNNEEQEAEFILKAMTLLQNKIDRLQKENQELKPKADYTDKVLNPTTYKKLITTTDIAKDLGMSAMKLNKLLNTLGVIYKQSGNWYLYSQHQDKVPEFADYVVNEHGQSLKWTEKGRKFIIEEIEKINKAS